MEKLLVLLLVAVVVCGVFYFGNATRTCEKVAKVEKKDVPVVEPKPVARKASRKARKARKSTKKSKRKARK